MGQRNDDYLRGWNHALELACYVDVRKDTKDQLKPHRSRLPEEVDQSLERGGGHGSLEVEITKGGHYWIYSPQFTESFMGRYSDSGWWVCGAKHPITDAEFLERGWRVLEYVERPDMARVRP